MALDLFDSFPNEILEAKTYADFKTALADSNCARCALWNSRTRIVVDRGNPEARIVIIGEAPGENEDLQGKAFVGRAGRLLDELMKEIGFDTDKDTLIVNIVKCRPPENRAPQPKEVAACFPYLKKQLSLVKPKVVLLLGAVALRHVFPQKREFSMQKEAGRFFEHPDYPEIQFMVLFHPAYILRDPRQKPQMRRHLKLFHEYWRQLKIISIQT